VIWEQREGGVWLVLGPTDVAELDDVLAEAEAAAYDEVDAEAIAEILEDRQGRLVASVNTSRRPGAVAVTVSDDGMAAFVRVYPPGPLAPDLRPEDVRIALENAGVTHGIDEEEIAGVALDEPGTRRIAVGIEPEDGVDGDIVFLVEQTMSVRPLQRDDGGVDMWAEATIPNVTEGEQLAEVIPPTQGTSGWTVKGEELLARKGKAATIPPLKNVAWSEDGGHLLAAIDGLLELSAARIYVRPDLTIRGDVDFKTGSIDFHGDVIVQGDVRPGFRVKAGGRVVVQGDVDQAEVMAESLVWIRGAAVGESCIIRSNGDIKVRTVHEARVEARGSVFIEKEASEATILASVDLVFESPRNRLVGGTVLVGHEVVAAEIGAVGETITRVSAGIDPFTAEEDAVLVAERQEHTTMLERITPAATALRKDTTQLEAMDDERRAAAQRLLSLYESLVDRLNEIERRLAEIRPADDPETKPRIIARTAMRPGVVLTVKRARRIVDVPRFRVAAVEMAGGVELVPIERDASAIRRPRTLKV
jgi:uncharacterized protein (DUF342 family)